MKHNPKTQSNNQFTLKSLFSEINFRRIFISGSTIFALFTLQLLFKESDLHDVVECAVSFIYCAILFEIIAAFNRDIKRVAPKARGVYLVMATFIGLIFLAPAVYNFVALLQALNLVIEFIFMLVITSVFRILDCIIDINRTEKNKEVSNLAG